MNFWNSLGGDDDTQAAIAGSVAEAFWGGVPDRIEAEIRQQIEPEVIAVVDRFNAPKDPL